MAHDPFGRAIILAGAPTPVRGVYMLNDAPCVVGWRSLTELLLGPEFAWLADPTMIYYRLPMSATDVAYARASHPVAGAVIPSPLEFELPQVDWALARLDDAICAARWEDARNRVVALTAFCSDRWPGVVSSELRHLGNTVGMCDAAASRDRVAAVRRVAPQRAVRSRLAPLFHGGTADLVNSLAGPLTALCRACESGLVTPDRGIAILKDLRPAAERLARALAIITMELEQLGLQHVDAASDIRQVAAVAIRELSEMIAIVRDWPQGNEKSLAGVERHACRCLDALHELTAASS